jgi:hypothetical protein
VLRDHHAGRVVIGELRIEREAERLEEGHRLLEVLHWEIDEDFCAHDFLLVGSTDSSQGRTPPSAMPSALMEADDRFESIDIDVDERMSCHELSSCFRQAFGGTMIIHETPNLSAMAPKRLAKNVGPIGICTVPSAASAL